MSGLLRRIKRSRAADAGETPAEGQAAAPDGAPTRAETPAGDAVGARRAPLIQADPELPAGVDPDAAAMQPPQGRRGRLRRRLRYLRRARELMLRDLGGLLYEVHRSGGGDVAAHGTVIAAKVQRLASMDAEAGAIETALAAPRAEAVVFQPGVGGTCNFCGELYGSAARFCSHCGSPTGSAVRATPAPVSGPARPVPPMPKPAEPEPSDDVATDETAEIEPRAGTDDVEADETTAETAVIEPQAGSGDVKADAAPDDEPTGQDGSADDEPGTDRSRNPFGGIGNGRAEDHAPPDLSSGDPLARESRS
jgi:hypothetical protein